MKLYKLKDFIKGWFVGNFEKTIIKTNKVEIAIKEYNAGDKEELHYHKIATELTCILTGKVLMNGIVYERGDIVEIKPKESTDFECLENSITAVVKYPGVNNDKYLGRYNG